MKHIIHTTIIFIFITICITKVAAEENNFEQKIQHTNEHNHINVIYTRNNIEMISIRDIAKILNTQITWYEESRIIKTPNFNICLIDKKYFNGENVFNFKHVDIHHNGRTFLTLADIENIFNIRINLEQKILNKEDKELKLSVDDLTQIYYKYSDKVHKLIPILMYHVIDEMPSEGLEGLFTSPDKFKEQLDWLKSSGYNTVTMKEVLDHWNLSQPILENPIVLTFDDGRLDGYTTVLPLLIERDMVGSFYIMPKFVGS